MTADNSGRTVPGATAVANRKPRLTPTPPRQNLKRIRRASLGDGVLDTLVFVVMLLCVVVTLYPFFNSLAISLNHADDTVRGGITLVPRVFTWRNYELIYTNAKIYTAYFITFARTAVGTVTGLFFTAILSFGLAHKRLIGRRFYTMLCLIPMYFGGGLIPTYFLIRNLHMINKFWVYIIPNLVNLWNMILMRTYFQGIPEALEESARIDGANHIRVFFRIIFPISTPIIATVGLYVAVFHWNSWFDAAMFVTKQELKPMQTVLMSIINEAKFAEQIAQAAGGAMVDMSNISRGKAVNVRSLTMATMIVTILPIIMVYPFIQRYFIKGIMIGSIKG
ncbi:MAG: carbohydrate ABC transporter permease [Oscillospiraceae bacterium]|nr:carbohydrate ABC transporter permease [Oscillospiraceae bacterium]